MSIFGIRKTILSISSPGPHLEAHENENTRQLTRHCNTFAAELKKKRPEQFGFWASVPLPDVAGSIAEIKYTLEELNADGATLLTNHHGTYLGNRDFEAVFDELNRRHATVFIHPTTPCLGANTLAVPTPEYTSPMFEFLFDSARAVINLFLSGNRPMLNIPGIDPGISYDWVKERLNNQFYFDTAGFTFPEQIQGILQHVSVDRILYGSDFPFTPLGAVIMLSNEHDKWLSQIFPKKEHQKATLDERGEEKLLGTNAGAHKI